MAKGYTRERRRLTIRDVERAVDMVCDGKVPGRGVDWADEQVRGLVLRITPTALTWYFKTEKVTLRLGAGDRLTLNEARNQAMLSKVSIKRGRDPRRQLAAFEDEVGDGRSAAEAADTAALVDDTPIPSEAERRANGPWLWGDLVEEFLAAKRKKLRVGYFDQYASYLRHPAFGAIQDRWVDEIGIADLERVRDAIAKENADSTAWRAVQQGKAALSWAWKFHAGVSGLARYEYAWWQRWSLDYASEARTHVPTIEELARTLVLAERHRSLGATEHATSAGVLAGLWGLVLTAQRTAPLVLLRRDRLFDLPGRPGWKCANWTGAEMKGGTGAGRPHALPIPPAAVATLERFWAELDEPTAWCFPSIRGSHIAQNALNQALYRLGGKANAAPRAKRAHRDLLTEHGIRPWIPHDVRRAIATFLADRRLGGAASAILAHRPSKEEHERERVEVVTRLHYDHSQRIDLKSEGMEAWVAAVLAAYEAEIKRPRIASEAA